MHTTRWIVTLVTILALSCLLTAPPAQAQVQSMAILSGAVAQFEGIGGSAAVQAFCMDLGRHTPRTADTFATLDGKVRLTFQNGATRELSLPDVSSYFSVSGSGNFSSVKLTRKDPTLRKVEFLTPSVAHAGDADDFERAKSFANHLASVDFKGLSQREIQERIWRSEAFIERTETTPDGTAVTYEYRRRDPARSLKQTIIDLQGRGDSIVIHTPSGKSFVIDTGLASASLTRILRELGTPQHAVLITTHLDADHIGNAVSVLQAGAGNWDGAIANTFQPQTQKASDLFSELGSRFTNREDVAGSSIALYQPSPAGGLNLQRRTLSAGLGNKAAPVSVYDLHADTNVDIQLLQFRNPKTSNQSSIITRVTHNGYSTVYLGDADPTVLGELNRVSEMQEQALDGIVSKTIRSFEQRLTPEQREDVRRNIEFANLFTEHSDSTGRIDGEQDIHTLAILDAIGDTPLADEVGKAVDHAIEATATHQIQFECDFLKWPHHAALPTSVVERQKLARYLTLANPKVIVLSSSDPELRGQDIQAVREFVRKVLPDVKIKVTGVDGSINVLSDLMKYLDLERGFRKVGFAEAA